MQTKFIFALIPLFLSVGIIPFSDASESDQICINKVWIENTKGKIACVTPTTAEKLVERGWGTMFVEMMKEQYGIIDVPIPITEVTAAQTMYSEEERAQSFRVIISNIVEPLPVHFFEKFAFTSVDIFDPNDPRGRVYDFREPNPQFYLESLPSADKIPYYNYIADWMDRGSSMNEFDLAVDVLDGAGAVIQTWEFTSCEITGYGTYLHDTTFIYSYSGIQDVEIRDRANFSCAGVHLETP